MKIAIQIIKFFLLVALCFTIFVWLMYHGSGHKIPLKTDILFGVTCASLIAFYFLLFVLRKKYK